MSTILLNSLNVSKSTTNTSTQQISGLTTLISSLNNSATTIPLFAVSDASGQIVTTGGTLLIDSEYITYTSVDGNGNPTNAVRGAFNSTATSHSSGASVYGVFVGVGELNPQPNVGCSLYCDTAGTLYFQYSNDGTSYGQFPTNGFNVSANITEFQTAVKLLRYFRIVFKNSSSSKTTSFSSYVYYGSFGQSQLPLNQSISNDYTSIITRSVLTGQNPTDSFDNLRADGYVFQTTSLLAQNASYTSSVYSTSGYTQLQTELYSDVSGTLVGTWYTESTGTSSPFRTFTRPYDAGDGYAYFSSPIFGPYIKYTYTTDASQSTFYLGMKFLTKSVSGQIVNLNDFISNTMVANLGRNVLVGETEGEQYVNVPVTNEGHLEVAVHDPINPFYSLHTENLVPLSQSQGVYAYSTSSDPSLNPLIFKTSTVNGAITDCSGNLIRSRTAATTGYNCAQVNDIEISTYSPGQGLISRFTGVFDQSFSNVTQMIGISNGQDTLAFGYNGASEFGIIYNSFGVLPVWSLTVSTITSPASVTIILFGVSYTFTISGVTSASTAAYLIAAKKYSGWTTDVNGATVRFQYFRPITNTTLSTTGSTNITFSSTTNTTLGVEPTKQFIGQSSWNGDPCNGTGRSGFNINPTKGNIYQIGVQYLGFGTITFKVEKPGSNYNNSSLLTCHTINNPNSLTKPTLSIPSFNFLCYVDSSGSSTVRTVSSGSFGIFSEGIKKYYGNRFTHNRSFTVASIISNPIPFYTVMNGVLFNGKLNKKTISCLDLRMSSKPPSSGTVSNTVNTVTIYIYKNVELSGTAISFSPFNSNYSCAYIDSGSTAFSVTTPANETLLSSFILVDADTFSITLDDVNIYPGETLTFAYTTTTVNSTNVGFTLNVREDD